MRRSLAGGDRPSRQGRGGSPCDIVARLAHQSLPRMKKAPLGTSHVDRKLALTPSSAEYPVFDRSSRSAPRRPSARRAPVLEQHRRDRANPNCDAISGFLVDVRLGDLDLALHLGGDLLERRTDDAARTTPAAAQKSTTTGSADFEHVLVEARVRSPSWSPSHHLGSGAGSVRRVRGSSEGVSAVKAGRPCG